MMSFKCRLGRRGGSILTLLWILVVGFPPTAGAEPPEPSKPKYPLAETGPAMPDYEPASPEAVEEAFARGVAFLMEDQNEDGSWGSPRNTKGLNIYAPVPGAHHAFQTATTSLVLAALLEAIDHDRIAEDRLPEVREAVDRGESWMFEHLPKLRRADGTAIYNTWGHAYSIQALVRMLDRDPDDEDRVAKIGGMIEQQIEMLGRFECVDGGWCYYDFDYHTQRPAGSTISFVTATVLVALHEAAERGFESPEKMIDRAKASILRQRYPDFAYAYGEYLKYSPHRGINRPGGSLGRSQACNLAMRYWGDEDVTDAIVRTWLDRLCARNGWLDIGRKRPIPHESWFSVAGYFFYYGHYYAARCIELLPEDQRDDYRNFMARLLVDLQEKDGSWWDYPLYSYHQPYGTAFALMTLERCLPEEPSEAEGD